MAEDKLLNKLTESVLKLEKIDTNLYRGSNLWKPVGGRAVFGGQVVGQALVAAGMTKPTDVHIHSMHCYFIRPGNPDMPILYSVVRPKDGYSFSNRTVSAIQDGKTIFNMLVSYHINEEGPFEYQYKMPVITSPEELLDYESILRNLLESSYLSDKRRNMINKVLASEIPVDIRPVNPMKYMHSNTNECSPKQYIWIKSKGIIGDDHNLHRCVAAYLSDMSLLGTALLPFPNFKPTMMASLDHSMWFHSHFKADEWMLYECEAPRSVGGRSLAYGRLWKQDGTLAVSVAQEGVVRGKMITSKLHSKL